MFADPGPHGGLQPPQHMQEGHSAERKQSGRFLECIDDTFLTQVIEKLKKRGVLLDLTLSYKEGLVGDVKVKGCFGCSDHGIVEFTILRARRKVRSKLTTLDFR